MNDLQSTFLILSASFSSTSYYFSSGITLKTVAFYSLRLHVCVVVFIHEKKTGLVEWKPRNITISFISHVMLCRAVQCNQV